MVVEFTKTDTALPHTVGINPRHVVMVNPLGNDAESQEDALAAEIVLVTGDRLVVEGSPSTVRRLLNSR